MTKKLFFKEFQKELNTFLKKNNNDIGVCLIATRDTLEKNLKKVDIVIPFPGHTPQVLKTNSRDFSKLSHLNTAYRTSSPPKQTQQPTDHKKSKIILFNEKNKGPSNKDIKEILSHIGASGEDCIELNNS